MVMAKIEFLLPILSDRLPQKNPPQAIKDSVPRHGCASHCSRLGDPVIGKGVYAE